MLISFALKSLWERRPFASIGCRSPPRDDVAPVDRRLPQARREPLHSVMATR